MMRNRTGAIRRAAGAVASAFIAVALAAGCAVPVSGPVSGQAPAPRPASPPSSTRAVDAAQVNRLKQVMIPLLRAANTPRAPGQVRAGIVDDAHGSAGSAGQGQFLVTAGLLTKAGDEQLAGVLAHEVAHDDLGHVAKAQTLGAGLAVGMVVLDQLFPGSGSLT